VEQAYVRITSYHDRTLDRYVVLKNIFQDLLNFLIADEVITLSIQAINKSTFNSNEKEDLSESKQINSIQILYSSTISEKMDKLSIKQPYLFQYGEIKEQFSKIVRKWFDLKKNWFCLWTFFWRNVQFGTIPFEQVFDALWSHWSVSPKIMEKSSKSRKQHEEMINRMIPYIENLNYFWR
jgi:hypothetical protein